MLGLADCAQRSFFPPTVDELLPNDHQVRFAVQVVGELDLEEFEKEFSDIRGRRGYPPFMFIAGGRSPDHTTLSTFRKRHGDEFKRLAAQSTCFIPMPWS